jgi:hypothetical protein
LAKKLGKKAGGCGGMDFITDSGARGCFGFSDKKSSYKDCLFYGTDDGLEVTAETELPENMYRPEGWGSSC